MGKLTHILIFLLMLNLIGYIILTSAGQDTTGFVGSNSLLRTLYTAPTNLTPESGSVSQTWTLGNTTTLAGSVPTQPNDNFFDNAGAFIDRIFMLFGFIRVIFAFLFVPAALFGYGLALPWELTLLLGVPLATLYILGLIDLIGGGES